VWRGFIVITGVIVTVAVMMMAMSVPLALTLAANAAGESASAIATMARKQTFRSISDPPKKERRPKPALSMNATFW
jgi:hypothetical protein